MSNESNKSIKIFKEGSRENFIVKRLSFQICVTFVAILLHYKVGWL